jgi:hypothetical protein
MVAEEEDNPNVEVVAIDNSIAPVGLGLLESSLEEDATLTESIESTPVVEIR